MPSIFVRIPDGRTIPLVVPSSDTVEDVMAKSLQDRDLIARNNAALLFGGKLLEKESTMCDNNIQNNATLRILFRLPGGTMIKVKTLTGKEVEIDIEPTDTVARIKQRVEEKEGIPPLQQRLIFAGKQMADDKTVDSYNIEGGSVLHLVLALRGGRSPLKEHFFFII